MMRRAFTRSLSSSSDKKNIIVNALGTDRLGIVSDMTKEVVDNGGSIGESQALKIGSNFSITMLVTVPEDRVDVLTSAISSMDGLTTHLIEAALDVSVPTSIGYSGRFRLRGSDHTGIVHQVTSLLNKHGLSVDMMDSVEEPAPFGCATLFHLDGIATATLPLQKNFDSDVVRKELSVLADTFNCDIELVDDVERKDRLTGTIWENVA